MKVRIFNPETTNPFADAAGDSASGDNAALGQTSQVATDWEQAVQAVVGRAGRGSGGDSSKGHDSNQEAASSQVEGAQSINAAPMGNQWDRLSMTVASLVAWNLTNEVAPDAVGISSEDSVAGAIAALDTLATTTHTGGQATDTSIAVGNASIAVGNASIAVGGVPQGQASTIQTPIMSADPTPAGVPPTTTQILTEAPVSTPQLDNISARIAGQAGAVQSTPNHTFREGKMLAPNGVRDVLTSTESEPAAAVTDARARAGTMNGTDTHSATYAPSVRLNPEIPTSLAEAAVQVDSSTSASAVLAQTAASVLSAIAKQQRHTPTPGEAAGPDGLPVSDQARVSPEVEALVRKMAPQASAASSDARPVNPPPASGQGTSSLSASTVSVAASTPAPGKASQSSSPILPHRAPQSSAAPAGFDPAGDAPGTQMGQPMTSSEFGQSSSPDRLAARFQAASLGGQADRTVTTEVSHASGEVGAGQASPTQPISDLERDFSMTDSMIDAEHIAPDEVPELPVTDPAQIDIDIDDPGGHVRLDMSRQAEEVTVRFETPEKLVEEYRNLEKEIENALEDAGMSLADYEAAADSDDEERSDRETRERTSSGSQDRESGSEETPKRGRLLNRIV